MKGEKSMSDEVLNNAEETEALFVAKQKKKEEDQKAAKEEAERKLKEAEVARMEAELKAKKAKAVKGRIIAIAVGVVVIIATMSVIFSIRDAVTDIGKVDYAALNFDSEYMPKSSDYQVRIKYPGELYSDVLENSQSKDSILLEFVPNGEGLVTTKVILDYISDSATKEKATKGFLSIKTPKLLTTSLTQFMEEKLKEVLPGAVTSDVVVTDYLADDPGKYFYSCNFTSVENSGGVSGWYELGEDGVAEVVAVICMAAGDDPSDGAVLRDAFVAQNSDDALLVAGMNPPAKGSALDGQLEYPEIDLKLKVPKDQFFPRKMGNYMIYGDLNGAQIAVIPTEFEQGFANTNFDMEKYYENCQVRSEERLGQMLIGISNKQQFSPEYISETGMDFSITYTFDWDESKYFELFFTAPWTDDEGKDYFLEIEFICPFKNMDEYVDIYSGTISSFLGVEE